MRGIFVFVALIWVAWANASTLDRPEPFLFQEFPSIITYTDAPQSVAFSIGVHTDEVLGYEQPYVGGMGQFSTGRGVTQADFEPTQPFVDLNPPGTDLPFLLTVDYAPEGQPFGDFPLDVATRFAELTVSYDGSARCPGDDIPCGFLHLMFRDFLLVWAWNDMPPEACGSTPCGYFDGNDSNFSDPVTIPIRVETAPIPLPAGFGLLGLALGLAMAVRRRFGRV